MRIKIKESGPFLIQVMFELKQARVKRRRRRRKRWNFNGP
jgi:hypothetical protein